MKELWHGRVTGPIMRIYGPLAIPVDRATVDAAALKRSLRALAGGALLIVFPEGGISPDGRLRPFHRGAAMLAARAGAPIIPVAIQGTAEALPLGRVVPRMRPITIRVGAPIAPPSPERDALLRAGDAAAVQIASLRAQTG